jgi:hypothetical protein
VVHISFDAVQIEFETQPTQFCYSIQPYNSHISKSSSVITCICVCVCVCTRVRACARARVCVCVCVDRLCGLVVRVLGYRSGGPGSIPGTTKKKK